MGAQGTAGLLVPGNIDLNNRPRVQNADGSISTVRSIGVNIDGKEVLIPTVVGNRVVSNADAIAEYKRTGQHLGIFDTPEHSTAYAQRLHEDQAKTLDMPPPTREQFDAAAKKVLATAPSGLSRDEFYALIDRELSGVPTASLVGARGKLSSDTQDGPAPEPDTYWGGFKKGLADYFTPAAKGTMDSLSHLAQPTTAADMAGLLIPADIPNVVSDLKGGAKVFGRAGSNAMREAKEIGAARGTSSLREIPKQVIEQLTKEWNKPELKGPKRASLLSSLDRVENPPQVNEPWMPETADPEGWRRSQAPPESFEHPQGWEPESADLEGWRGHQAPPQPVEHPGGWEPEAADLEGWRKTPRDPHDPLTVQPTSQTDKVRASNLDDEIGRLMGGGTPGNGTSAPVMEHLPDSESSGWPPDGGQGDWHSGATPGSPEAAQASTLHGETRAMDNASAMNPNDRDALMELLTKMFPPQRP